MRLITSNEYTAYAAHPVSAGMRAIPQGVIGGAARTHGWRKCRVVRHLSGSSPSRVRPSHTREGSEQ